MACPIHLVILLGQDYHPHLPDESQSGISQVGASLWFSISTSGGEVITLPSPKSKKEQTSSKYNAVMMNDRHVKVAATRHGKKYG
jgi:hypothetical protein